MKKIFILLLTSSSWFIHAQTVKKYANEYLNIGVDAAALAMGNSMVAHSNNAFSTYWNPAGLTHLEGSEIGLMHANYFGNIAQYDYLSYATKVSDQISLGMGLTRFGVDDILNTTELINQNGEIDYSKITKFSTSDYALNLSIGYKTGVQGLSVGGNAKILYRNIGKFANAWGYGLDAAVQYQTESNWKFGAMLRDFTFTETIWNFDEEAIDKIKNAENTDEFPDKKERTMPKVQLGVGKSLQLSENFGLLATTQLNIDFFETNALLSVKGLSVQPSLGFQADYRNIAFLRLGVNNFQNETQIDDSKEVVFQPNAGIGFLYKGIAIDYALTNIGNHGGGLYSHIFSLRFNFNDFKK